MEHTNLQVELATIEAIENNVEYTCYSPEDGMAFVSSVGWVPTSCLLATYRYVR